LVREREIATGKQQVETEIRLVSELSPIPKKRIGGGVERTGLKNFKDPLKN
jgi:hypothetical protein